MNRVLCEILIHTFLTEEKDELGMKSLAHQGIT